MRPVVALSDCCESFTHLKGVVEPVDWDRVDGTDHLQHTVKVVKLLENLQNLYDPCQHCHPLLQVHGLYNTPETHTHRVTDIWFLQDSKTNVFFS